jgi:N-acetylmuramoyl-L-alanine amidase
MLDPAVSAGDDNTAMKRQVSDGRGDSTSCQASGAATNDGYPEHTVAWDTTLRVRVTLTGLGMRTATTRGNDNDTGPCVDERAVMANALPSPKALVSIRAYTADPSQRGFVASYPSLPLNGANADRSVRLARAMRDQLSAGDISPAEHTGTDALRRRSDLGELNLTHFPAVQIALGNMDNPADAELMQTPEGRQQDADAIAKGIALYLDTQPR